jgi:hypothetical protein
MHVADAVIGFAPHPLPVHQATNAAGAAIIAQLAMGGQGAHMPAGPMEGLVHGGQSCMPCIPIAEQRPAPPGFHCFICKNVYRDPRLLNCLHTFCLDCLVEMKQPPRRWAHPPNNGCGMPTCNVGRAATPVGRRRNQSAVLPGTTVALRRWCIAQSSLSALPAPLRRWCIAQSSLSALPAPRT